MNNEILIELVRGRPQLWNTAVKEYRNSETTARNWEEIAGVLMVDVESVKKRWRTLRDRFTKETKGHVKVTGQGATRLKQWQLEEQMMFLKPSITPRTTISNFENQVTLVDLAGMEEEEILYETSPSELETEMIEDGLTEFSTIDDNPQPSTSQGEQQATLEELISPQSKKRAGLSHKKRKRAVEEDHLAEAILQNLHKLKSHRDYKREEHFYLLFARNIEASNLSLSSRLAIQAKCLETLREAIAREGMLHMLNFFSNL